eukprot:174259-Rhodomonas_salina.1
MRYGRTGAQLSTTLPHSNHHTPTPFKFRGKPKGETLRCGNSFNASSFHARGGRVGGGGREEWPPPPRCRRRWDRVFDFAWDFARDRVFDFAWNRVLEIALGRTLQGILTHASTFAKDTCRFGRNVTRNFFAR